MKRFSRIVCEQCGLRYAPAALARQLTLGPGDACRRCGGRLRPEDPDPSAGDAPVVTAVRSAVVGRDRLPFG